MSAWHSIPLAICKAHVPVHAHVLEQMPFYITVLLCLPIDVLTAVLGGIVLLSLCFYYPVNLATRRFGKKRLVLVS